MTIDRRDFIKAGVAAATVSSSLAEAAAPGYALNRAPLAPAAFLRLPPGANRATGWLQIQLDRQVGGLCGRFAEISQFLDYDNTGWTNPAKGGWEEVPYWLRGYVDMAYVSGNATALSTASRWMNGVIATQAADGFFGPSALRTALNGHADVWPHMPMLHALRSHAEYTGDARVQPFLTKFFSFLMTQPLGVFSDGWGRWRWADTLDVVYWLYNRTGDAFLLDLVRRIHANSANWIGGLPDQHNVNVAQGFREPAMYGVLSRDPAHRAATYTRYNQVQSAWGQFPGGGFAGDENSRDGMGDPRQGFETCGIVEYMLSHEILTRITGDAVWADRTEELAFNSLPAALDPLGRSVHYVTSANSVDLDNAPKTGGQFQNGFAMQSFRPGITQYRCCPHNYGMGWPYYVEEMWLATPDGGLCAALYGPCRVTARVASGTQVTIVESTHYPFADGITLQLQLGAATTFPLVLRIPGWCAAPEIKVNGNAVAASAGPAYVTINRAWSNNDTVAIRFPAQPVVKRWPTQHNAVSVNRGALSFSLQITENWTQTGGSAQFPEFDVHAGSAWNYGLVPNAVFTVATGGNPNDPFTPANAPIRLSTSAQRIPEWQTDGEHVVTPLQDGPVLGTTPVEQVTLIPMGAARLRITQFPQMGGSRAWGGAPAAFKLQNRNSGKVLGVDGMSIGNSANVVQADDNGTADHLWNIIDAGNGYAKIQNANSGKLLAVENMSTLDSARVQQYADNGSADHLWQFIDVGNGFLRLRNVNSGKVMGIAGMSTAPAAQAVQFSDNGTADHDWRLLPAGPVKILNLNSGKVLAVEAMSTADSARVQQFANNGTPDHAWTFVADADGSVRIRNQNSGKVLGVAGMSSADSAQVVQYADNGTADHRWLIRVNPQTPGVLRLQNVNSGKVLAVHDMSFADSVNIEQYTDNGSADHNWRIIL